MEANYGKRIREVRKLKKVTQAELADRSGIALSTIRRYEMNKRQPNLEILGQIANALDMDLKDFFWTSSISQDQTTIREETPTTVPGSGGDDRLFASLMEDPQNRDFINRFSQLPPDKQEAMLTMLRALEDK